MLKDAQEMVETIGQATSVESKTELIEIECTINLPLFFQ